MLNYDWVIQNTENEKLFWVDPIQDWDSFDLASYFSSEDKFRTVLPENGAWVLVTD